ncbi:MAG: branched-chain amino acid transaminase [Litorilinea sp.]
MTRFAYFHDDFCPIDDARVSIMTHSFNYGTGCFGGVRAYWNAESEQLLVFRLRDHMVRFLNSAKLLMAQIDHTPDSLAAIVLQLLGMEAWRENSYVRPIIYKSDERLGVQLHDLHDGLAIFSVPMGRYLSGADAIRVGVSSWRRIDDLAIPPRGKLIGAYMNSALIKTEAVLNGYDEALVLDQSGHVSEASAANFVMVRNGTLVTPPRSANVLEGITLDALLEIATQKLGLPLEMREIDRSEVYYADEAFLCGTGVQIEGIGELDHRPIGNGGVGPITAQLREHFLRIVSGQDPDYVHWVTPVPIHEHALM